MPFRAILDTTFVIDITNGKVGAADLFELYKPAAISVITWMEAMVGARTENEAALLRAALTAFEVIQISPGIADVAVSLRQQRRLHLLDAIIWATARVHAVPLITSNTKDFPIDDPMVIVPPRAQ